MRKAFSRLATFFLYLVSLLPFPVLYLLADAFFIVLFYGIRYRRKVVQDNLRNAFPDKTDLDRRDIERKFYHHLADLFVETVKLASISAAEVRRRFHVINPELFEGLYNEGKSLLGVVGHYGNWEMAALAGSLITKRKNLIIYKPLHNAVFDTFFLGMRSRFGAVLVPMKMVLRKIAEYKNEPTITVFAGDQTPVQHETHYFTRFLNQQTAMFLGVEKMAHLTGYPVCFCDIRKIKRGFYTCKFVLLEENPKYTNEHEITEKHVRYLENVIQKEPQYWLWSHRRWKFKPKAVSA